MINVEETLRSLIGEALREAASDRGVELVGEPVIMLERPRREGQGDWASNVAMQMAKVFGASPREIAQAVVDRLDLESGYLDRAEVAGPGFINFFLSPLWAAEVVAGIRRQGEAYGRCDIGRGRKVQVEFVSANPTGPLHVGHGRGAIVGDVTANILAAAGWEVEREYYINDAGLQMTLLGKSVQSRYFDLLDRSEAAPFPEDGYKGEYIYDLARELVDRDGDAHLEEPLETSLPVFQAHAVEAILEMIRRDLKDFGVRYDVWFSEKSLYDSGAVREAAEFLKKRGFAYEKDGAVWFKATEFDDAKDRVLFRSNGVATYFMSDIAYHKNKYDRGFDLVIDVWGADHHGYVPRMTAAVESLGRKAEDLRVLLIQFVNLLRGGEQVAMSTRSGQFVTLRDVIDEVGVDASRYFFVMRSCDSHLDFDLALAKEASNENPVYYVQYAHARIHSLFREAAGRGVALSGEDVDLRLLDTAEEQALIRKLAAFPEEVAKASEELAPHRVTFYLYDLASHFHSFYNAHRVLDAEPDLRRARLALLDATRITLANALGLLGVQAPQNM
ncbi:MAG: arginine--tRNA ligase [Synergistales bacterium]|nr:arginine--tRNA ligase [Synergistales bacterium]